MMADKAKKLSETQLRVLRNLKAQHENGFNRGLLPVPVRTANTLEELGRLYIKYDHTWFGRRYYRITRAGLDYLAQLAAPAPATPAEPDNETAANLRQALKEARDGDTHPVATLWDGITFDARSDVPRAEYDALKSQLQAARQALADCVSALKKYSIIEYREDVPAYPPLASRAIEAAERALADAGEIGRGA
jgi:hypothetical protein